jgi:hypothetical protein
VNVCRLRQLAALVVVVVLAATAVAGAAASKPGWEIKRTVSKGPYTAVDTARHCGASEFGAYTTRLAFKYTAGPLDGKTVQVVVTFALRDDHQRHRFRFVSVTGTAMSTMSQTDRRSVERALRSTFSQYAIEVLHVLTGPRLTTRLWAKQKVVSTGVLGLARRSCSP